MRGTSLLSVLVVRVLMIRHDPAVDIVNGLAHGVLVQEGEATILKALDSPLSGL